MFQKLFTRRRAVAVATVALGMSGMSLAFAGTAGASQTITIPQNGSDHTPNPYLIIGSGSNTAYAIMVSESDLFNEAPGCDLTGAGNDSKYENCGTDPVAPGDSQVNGANPGENGYTQSDENPYNDYSVEAPAVGSGGGVNQLNSTDFPASYGRSSANPAGSNGTAAQNYEAYAVDAVSWSAFKSLKSPSNVVTDYAAAYTPTLSYQEAEDVWQGAVTTGCSKSVYYKYGGSGSSYPTTGHITVTASPSTNNWECLATANTTSAGTTLKNHTMATAKALAQSEANAINKPIDCYIAQPGSGTAGTWANAMGYTKTIQSGDCLGHEGTTTRTATSSGTTSGSTLTFASGTTTGITVGAPVTWGTGTGTVATIVTGHTNEVTLDISTGTLATASTTYTFGQNVANHINLFENQMSQIAQSPDADQANAIYFYSYGKFKVTCSSVTAGSASSAITGICAGTKTTAGQYTTEEGNISGSSGSPTGTTPQWPGEVGADGYNNIQGKGGGVYGDLEFPVLRNLFGVYNNSDASSPASQAALNFVSEYGFMCKPGTAGDFDPLTGVTYRTEIENNIRAQGFYPLDISPTKPFQEGTVTYPAYESGTPLNTPGYLTDPNYLAVDATTTAEAGNGDGSDGPSSFTAGNGIPTGDTNSVTDPYGFCLQSNG